ncbi:hypothetical protein EDC04DRAFT_453604 [Pisolithus marmoratus]|nr:hypothetical protein EDC04DRAFT_453604 [Pisolithus marmoratus]
MGDNSRVLLTPPPPYNALPLFPPAVHSRVPSYHSLSPQPTVETERLSALPLLSPAVLSPVPSYHSSSPGLTAEVEHLQVDVLEQGESDPAQAREQEPNPRTEAIRRHRRNNWPPCIPLIVHSIPDDIPEASRPLITRLYYLWLALPTTLVLNVVGYIFVWWSPSASSSYAVGDYVGGSVGYRISAFSLTDMSLIPSSLTERWAIIIPLLSFLLWYR